MKNIEQKEIQLQSHEHSQFIIRCPKCGKKLKRTRVKRIENIIKQKLFCKKCKFEKEIMFKVQ